MSRTLIVLSSIFTLFTLRYGATWGIPKFQSKSSRQQNYQPLAKLVNPSLFPQSPVYLLQIVKGIEETSTMDSDYKPAYRVPVQESSRPNKLFEKYLTTGIIPKENFDDLKDLVGILKFAIRSIPDPFHAEGYVPKFLSDEFNGNREEFKEILTSPDVPIVNREFLCTILLHLLEIRERLVKTNSNATLTVRQKRDAAINFLADCFGDSFVGDLAKYDDLEQIVGERTQIKILPKDKKNEKKSLTPETPEDRKMMVSKDLKLRMFTGPYVSHMLLSQEPRLYREILDEDFVRSLPLSNPEEVLEATPVEYL